MTTPLQGPLADSGSGLWIRTLMARPGTVTGTVPSGFDAYVRIFHPVQAQLQEWGQDAPVTVEARTLQWSELAQLRGTNAHPLMQWHSILAGYRNPVWNEPGWQYEDPLVGALAAGALSATASILAGHTGTPEQCFAGLWEGWEWLGGTGPEATAFGDADAVNGAGRLELPDRRYLLFETGVDLFTDRSWQERNGWDALQSPNLLWPADRAWFLATEIDFDSTIVGGSAALIADLLEAEALEARQVPPDGDLTRLGDLLNELPD